LHPILFKYGIVTIYSYGFCVALAFLAGVLFSMWILRRASLYSDKLWDLALVIMVSAVVGARLFYVIEFFGEYAARPLEVFFVWQGGLVFFGGLFFAAVAAIVFIRLNQMPLWLMLDCMTPGTILGYAIGRIGCFLNGCCYGCETTLPWTVHFPNVLGARHPTQLYAAGLALLAFLFLFWFLQRKKFDGQVFAFGLLYYGSYRFLIEFWRVNPRYWLGLSEAQVIAVLVFAAAVGLLIFLPRRVQSLFQGKP
jgi:phosphatidylglycerol:prolipoprotein diacylglycerol transferase